VCLQPGGHLNGEVLAHVARTATLKEDGAVLITGYTTKSIIKRSVANIPDETTAVDARRFYFVVHGRQHWSLAFWDTTTTRLSCFDSVKGYHAKEHSKIAQWIATFFGVPGVRARQLSTPQQPNGYDCGVYVIHHLETLTAGCTQLTQPDRDKRSKLLSSLQQHPHAPAATVTRGVVSEATPNAQKPEEPIGTTNRPSNKAKKPRPPDGKYPPLIVNQHFHKDQSSLPGLVPVWHGEALIAALAEVIKLTDSQLATLPDGISIETRRCHLRLAKLLVMYARARPAHLDMPASTWMCRAFSTLAKSLNWSASTRKTHFGNMLGLLERLDQYAPHIPHRSLKESSVIKDMSKKLTKEYNRTRAAKKPFLSRSSLHSMLQQADRIHPELRLMLKLCWATSARPTNALRLRRENVVFHGPGEVAVIFTDAKTTTRRGPYTVHTRLSAECFEELKSHLESLHSPSSLLFPLLAPRPEQSMSLLRTWMRRVVPRATIRMIRRGSLIDLAQAGATQDTLLNRSGHTNLRSLHDYLGAQLHLNVIRQELGSLPAML